MTRSAFDEFDPFHARWRAAMEAGAIPEALVEEAASLGERLVEETEVAGPEFALIAALAHLDTVREEGDEEDLADAADALVAEMAEVVHP